MSAHPFFTKDIAFHGRPKKQTLGAVHKSSQQNEPTPDEKILITLSRIESEVELIKETMFEIKDFLAIFGFRYKNNEKLAKVALQYRKNSRERHQRYRKNRGITNE